jgi:hypothetical protein
MRPPSVTDACGRRGGVLAAVLAACVALMPVLPAAAAPARATAGATRANTAEAKRRFQAGERLFKNGRYAEAAREYDHGYQLARLPGFLINIAHCHVRLGQLSDARILYEMYLEQAPRSARRVEVERAIASIDARLAAEKAAKPVPELPAAPSERDRQHRLAIDTIPPYDVPSRPAYVSDTPAPAPERRWLWPVLGGVAAGVVAGAAVILLGGISKSNGVKSGSIGTLGR